MVNNKKIGMVILNYNDYKTTIELIELIKNYDVIDHIVIVDNLSTNDSFKKLQKYTNKKIELIKSNKNGGYSYGNNYGAFYLINKYNIDILFIANPDVEFSEVFIQKISEILSTNNTIKAATGRNINLGETDCKIYGNTTSYFRNLIQCTLLIQRIFKSKIIVLKENTGLIKVDELPGSLFAIKAETFKEINGLDEGVFLYWEEAILGTKFRAKNYQSVIDTSVSYLHKESVTINKSVNYPKKIRIFYDSMYYYFENYSNISFLKKIILKLFILYGYYTRLIISKIIY